jgi:hypothetical protein
VDGGGEAGAGNGFGAGGGGGVLRMFFSEEKNQKTFKSALA